MWLFVLFAAWPLIEIGLFVTVGGWLGLWWSLAIVILTAALGILILRMQGPMAMANARAAMQAGGDPRQPLASGAMGFLAGILLILPGFLTDALGLLLLLPPVQMLVLTLILSRVQMQGASMQSGFRDRRSDDVIDGEWEEVQPRQVPPQPGKSRWTED